MSDTPSRRAVLGTSAATILGSLAGCTLGNQETEGGHLYVENTLPAGYQIYLSVTQGRDREGEAVVSGWYEVPSDTALQFQEVLEPGTAYTVTVHRPTVPSEDRVTVTINPCEGGGTGRDVSIRVRGDGMGVIPWGCNEDGYEELELEYVNPEPYTIDTPAEAQTTETES